AVGRGRLEQAPGRELGRARALAAGDVELDLGGRGQHEALGRVDVVLAAVLGLLGRDRPTVFAGSGLVGLVAALVTSGSDERETEREREGGDGAKTAAAGLHGRQRYSRKLRHASGRWIPRAPLLQAKRRAQLPRRTARAPREAPPRSCLADPEARAQG